jgi:nucleoid-associated protein YgaU
MTALRTTAVVMVVTVMALASLGCKKKESTMTAAPPPPGYSAGYDTPPPADVQFSDPAPAPGSGLAPVPMTNAPAAMGGGSYVIQKGDTLWSIAKRTYGDGKRWADIQAANPGLDPKKLPVGQQIVLP